MPLEVRTAGSQDISALKQLMLSYIVDFYESPRPSDSKLDTLISELLLTEKGIQFVAEQDGSLVGFATLYFSFSTTRADKVTIMNDLFVAEQARGTEAATALFSACEAYTRTHGYAAMLWETAADNHRAQSFYEKMGSRPGSFITYSKETANR
ncbi:GNAT family N-acetyltransferase [Fictibacillus iocasae]|uniref:GNAT family N-acetyltransferase n=1 Tax=Fictibacillus iocasae TaxID=2715437 RepID=A0ABW2NKC8_9BACL